MSADTRVQASASRAAGELPEAAPSQPKRALRPSEERRQRIRSLIKPLPQRSSGPSIDPAVLQRIAGTTKFLKEAEERVGRSLPGTTLIEESDGASAPPPAPLLRLDGIGARSSTSLHSPGTTKSNSSTGSGSGGSPITRSLHDSPQSTTSGSSDGSPPGRTTDNRTADTPSSTLTATPPSQGSPASQSDAVRSHAAAGGAHSHSLHFQFPQAPARAAERPDHKSDEVAPTPRRTFSVVRSPASAFLQLPTPKEAARMHLETRERLTTDQFTELDRIHAQVTKNTKAKAAAIKEKKAKERKARAEIRFGLTPNHVPAGVPADAFEIPWKQFLLFIVALAVTAVVVIALMRLFIQ